VLSNSLILDQSESIFVSEPPTYDFARDLEEPWAKVTTFRVAALSVISPISRVRNELF
jgi:hypothetical protein